MKMKFCSVLTAIILVLSSEMTVSAAAMPNPATDLNAQNSGARSTITLSLRGDSYTTTQEGVQCRCEISSKRVTAGTDKYGSFVTISSKSYNSSGASTPNGRGDGSYGNTVTTTYSTSSGIFYTYQEHCAPPVGTTVKITLTRY